MAVGARIGRAVAKAISGLKNPKVIAKTATIAGEMTAEAWVLNKLGEKVRAKKQAELHHDDGKVADIHVDADGNEYVIINGKKYRHDSDDDQLYNA